MKAIWKISKIILAFFLALAIIALIWYVAELATLQKGENAVPFIDFILYLLGFGDMDSKDHYMQTLFSTLGLFTVTLLSSVFTVSLFELRSKVKISKNICIESKDRATLALKAAGKDIYNLSATLISKCGEELTTEEQYFPFIAKKSAQKLRFRLAPGSALYNYLRSAYLGKDLFSQLILTISYTDIESGQEYAIAQKYQLSSGKNSNFLFADGDAAFEKEIENSIRNNTFPINLSSVWACEAEDLDLSYGLPGLTAKDAFTADVHMNSRSHYEPQSFTMAVTSDLLGNDWTTYADLNCFLKFDYQVEGDLAVTIELKYGDFKQEAILRPQGEFTTYSLSLNQLSYEALKNVRELCFTVFYKDVNPADPTGRFTIKNCVLEVEGCA